MRYIIVNFKRLVCQWQLYASILVIILSGIITLKRNFILHNLQSLTQIGALNLFIYSNIVENGYMSILAPILPVFSTSSLIFDDIRNGFYRNLANIKNSLRYFLSGIVSSSLMGGSLYVVTYLIMMLFYIIVDPRPSPFIEFRSGVFWEIYMESMLKYVFVFLINSFIFGTAYSFLGCGLMLIMKNKYTAIGIVMLLYLIPIYFINLLPNRLAIALQWIIPTLTFEISTYNLPIIMHITQLLTIIAISTIIVWISYRKTRIII